MTKKKTSLVLLISILFSLSPDVRAERIIDLKGRQLQESPNPIVPRWGLMPGIITVSQPVLILRKTSSSHPRGTILLFPGGGYHALAIRHEGELVSDFLNKQGYDVAILEYSIGSSLLARNKALKDARKAWNLLSKHGEEFGLQTKPMGVMGFSAGGHLATRLVHSLDGKLAPDSLILIYPAYLDEHAGPKGFDLAVTPPSEARSKVFVLIGDQDKPQWISGAKAYAQACRENGQKVNLYLLPKTGHGFGMKPDRTGAASKWERLFGNFLKTNTPTLSR
jgi:acetyl esterase/lipase